MTISPEALEKARGLVANYGSDPDGLLVGAIAAALQAERDAAAPKLPDDLAGLVERLNGVYRVPITDGLGAVGSGEEPDNPNEFVRRFETPPIQKEAAAAIQSLVARNAELRAEIAALKKEAADVVRPFAENAPPGSGEGSFELPDSHPITFRPDVPSTPSIVVGHFRAARSFLDKWEGRDG